MASNVYIENYVYAVKLAGGIKTKKPVTLSGTAANLAVGGTLAVTGTSTFTGAATFTANPIFSAGITPPTLATGLVGATVVLTAAQSGTVLYNNSTSGTPQWTLPAAAVGLIFYSVTTSTTNAIKFFTGTTSVIRGHTTAAGTVITSTATTGTFLNTQATAVKADSCTLWCDGTDWFATNEVGIWAVT